MRGAMEILSSRSVLMARIVTIKMAYWPAMMRVNNGQLILVLGLFGLPMSLEVRRLADDLVEGHPSYFVEIIDADQDATTLFGIDKENLCHSVCWF